jgi:hypothetical protein
MNVLPGRGVCVVAARWTVAFILMAGASQAWAQSAAPTSQPQSTPQRPGQVQPAPGENYDPPGIRMGGFLLYPSFELVEMYNDNVFATTNNRVGKFITVVNPRVDLKSNWNNHALNLFAAGSVGFYHGASSENFQDFSVGGSGRLDIQRNWYLFGGGSFSRRHEERGTPNALFGPEPNEYFDAQANVGYYQKFNRVFVRAEGKWEHLSYTNNKSLNIAGVVNNENRNRSEFTETLRVGYEFVEGTELWVQGGLNQRVYDSRFDNLGFQRSSNGWEIVGGATVDLGGITQVEGFAGFRAQDYRDARLGEIRGAIFGLAATWNPYVPLFIKPYVRRTIEETNIAGYSGYWSTLAGVNVDYRLRPNIRVSAGAAMGWDDYRLNNQVAGTPDRLDRYLILEIGVQYRPTENFFVGPSYQYTNRDSNTGGLDYGRNIFMLRGGVQL